MVLFIDPSLLENYLEGEDFYIYSKWKIERYG